MTKSNNGILVGATLLGVALLLYKKESDGTSAPSSKSSSSSSSTGTKTTYTGNTDFIKKNLAYAKAVEKALQVPWQVNLLIAAVESAWGKHPIGNNYHGIKADGSWHGLINKVKTPECVPTSAAANKLHAEIINVVAPHGSGDFAACSNKGDYTAWIYDKFRNYSSPAGSFLDFANFLHSNSRYKPAFAFTNDPKQFGSFILLHGYSTAQYVNTFLSLLSYIEKEAAK
jgi:flagellar protein FlgJ